MTTIEERLKKLEAEVELLTTMLESVQAASRDQKRPYHQTEFTCRKCRSTVFFSSTSPLHVAQVRRAELCSKCEI